MSISFKLLASTILRRLFSDREKYMMVEVEVTKYSFHNKY